MGYLGYMGYMGPQEGYLGQYGLYGLPGLDRLIWANPRLGTFKGPWDRPQIGLYGPIWAYMGPQEG